MKHYLFYPFLLSFRRRINGFEWKKYGKILPVLVLLRFFSALSVNAQTCNITDYLYLNDVTKNSNGDGVGFVHKLKLNSDKTATEIYSSGTKPWFPSGGVLKTPHGLGQDLNGNLYIGQTGDGPIAKIKCDGTLVKGTFIDDGGFNILSKDGFLYVNSNDGQKINRYALCDGSAQGYIILGGDYTYGTATLKDWGLDIDADGTFYASAGFNFTDRDKNTYLYRFKPTNADFINHTTYTANKSTGVGGTLKSGTGTNGISDRNEVWGITHDPAGNIYLVVRDWEDPSDTETWILKFDKNFNLVDSMVELTGSATGGIEGARGIVYYAPWDRLLIAGGPDGDCIAKVRPSDMTYVGALAPNEPDQTPKTLRIASEACPISATLSIDTTLCNVQAGDNIFLQNIIGKCNAPICGGTWTANAGNAGITFNECDLSFTVTNVAIGCGKFTLTNVGGTCGDFTITVNVDFANVTAPVIAGDQTVCADSENPAAFTITTPAAGSNTVKYQWQKSTVSCTDGFSNIAGAEADTYDPDVVSETTYYRVITTVDGSCTTPHGSCTDTSNCVTVTTKVCVPTCTPPSPSGSGQGTTICAETTSTITATGCDAVYALKWYSDAALTAEITTGVSGNNLTTNALTATADYYAACVKDATCKSAGTKITVTVVPKPTVSGSPNVTQATCNTAGTAANDDAKIEITGISNGSSYTVDGGASQALSGTAILLENLPNPAASKVYTIKIFNAAATDCFLEVTATLEPKVCVPTCTPPSPSGQGTTICAETTSTITATGCDAVYALKWYSDAALTAEITTGVSGNNLTTSALTATADYYAACVKDATCKSAGTKITVTVVPKPTVSGSPNVTQATCNTAGTAANNDASISITGITHGTNYSVDGGATQTLTGGAISLTGLANPAASKTYTIKIWNTDPTCFIEVTAKLDPKVCTPTPKGSLGDFVWKDTNNNGIQDETTPNGGGVAGVIIELYKGTVPAGKDTTDATGKYLFTNLDAGTYKIKVIGSSIPAGCEISSVKDAPSDDAKDSDVDKTTGESGNYIIDPTDPTKKDILTVDAALYSPCIKPNAGPDQTLACGTTAPTTFNLTDAPAGQKWKVLSVQPNTTVSVTTPAGLVTGMTAPGQYRFVLQTQSDSLTCRDTVSITVPDCNCPQVNILTPNATVCKDSLFPTLRITLLGSNTQGAGAAWYANATGGTPLGTGLSFKPTGVASVTDTFYVALTGASANCLALPRTPVIVTVQNCTEEVDLALKKSINTKIAQIGDVLTYTLKVWNESGTNATGVEVTDSIATTVQFQTGSFVASRGTATITGNVIKWVIGSIAANGDTVTLTYRVKATQEGVHFNTAEICKTNEKDVDSTPCNHDDEEDDIDRQCFTVPIRLCPGEKVQVSVPTNLTNVQWFKNGVSTAVGSGNVILLSDVGTYTFTASNQTCPANGCCPVIIEPGINCCPENVCIPFTVKKTKKEKK